MEQALVALEVASVHPSWSGGGVWVITVSSGPWRRTELWKRTAGSGPAQGAQPNPAGIHSPPVFGDAALP